MINNINRNNVLILTLLGVISFASIFSMEESNAKQGTEKEINFVRIFNPRSLKELSALYIVNIVNKDIKNADKNLPEELNDYIKNIQEIELRSLPKRARELFLSVADEHSPEMVKEALEFIDDLDRLFSKEQVNFIKKAFIAEVNQFAFKLHPFLSIFKGIATANRYILNLKKYKDKIDCIKKYYMRQLESNPNDLHTKVLVYYIDKTLQQDTPLEEDSEFLAALEFVNVNVFNDIYLAITINKLIEKSSNVNGTNELNQLASCLGIFAKNYLSQDICSRIYSLRSVISLLVLGYIHSDCVTYNDLLGYLEKYYEEVLKNKDNRFNFFIDVWPTLLKNIKKDNLDNSLLFENLLKYKNSFQPFMIMVNGLGSNQDLLTEAIQAKFAKIHSLIFQIHIKQYDEQD